MLRKSPYVEENYNYITSMMDSMKLQENMLNSAHNSTSSMPVQSNQLWNNQPVSNSIFTSLKDIDTKKQMESEFSVYDKTINLLNQGALLANNGFPNEHSVLNEINNNFTNHPFFNLQNQQETIKSVKCFGCLKEKCQDLMQVEDKFDGSQFSDCSYCRTSSCMSCTRRCDLCGRSFCKICVNVRYEEYIDRIVCLYCS